MQLVLINNRIVAHGENFLAMGGVVINTETGDKYENATIAECSGCPTDIDSVGYEYHAGVFVPCAPYGKGAGTVAVLCDKSCKSIKDSGFPSEYLCKVFRTTYPSTGSTSCGVECGFRPKVAVISCLNTATSLVCVMGTVSGRSFGTNQSQTNYGGEMSVTVTTTDTGLYWSSTTALGAMNAAVGTSVTSYYEITIWG
jgi:hypothetical protein